EHVDAPGMLTGRIVAQLERRSERPHGRRVRRLEMREGVLGPPPLGALARMELRQLLGEPESLLNRECLVHEPCRPGISPRLSGRNPPGSSAVDKNPPCGCTRSSALERGISDRARRRPARRA